LSALFFLYLHCHFQIMTNKIITEIAVFTPLSAIEASSAGADRIELCSGYSEGGLSPTLGSVVYVRKNCSARLHVMIRPRTGNFVYDEGEKKIILSDIEFCRQAGADGVVVGALLPDGNIDKEFISQVVENARQMSVTYHRAFDLCPDLHAALEDLMDCGVHRVLTSGGKNDAITGKEEIAELVRKAAGRIIILPGGGITPMNAGDFIKFTGVNEVHFSAKKRIRGNSYQKEGISLTSHGQVDDHHWYECDPEKVKEMKIILDQLASTTTTK
jgi:copper homeostasis protein